MGQRLQRGLVAHMAGDLADSQIGDFVDFALRTRSPLAREVVRHRALRGGSATSDGADAVDLDRLDIDPGWGSAWARMTALWDTDEDRLERAAAIFDAIARKQPGPSFSRPAATCYAQILLRLGRDDELQKVLPTLDVADVDRWCLRADLLNPWRHNQGTQGVTAERITSWTTVFNEALDSGLAHVTVLPDVPSHADSSRSGQRPEATPYQRLIAPTNAPTTASPISRDLVTVVMSAYRPGPDLHTAVGSVLAQTWSDLELIIVDDCSGPEYRDFLADVAAHDSRIRIVTAQVNSGTYAARNLALHHARGRYVTFQDSDDWTHPQRIEAQLQPLLDSESVLASRSRTLRAYPDLTMTYVGYSPERLNASSLLFEREPVLAAIGGFDETRKSADMEFPLRLKALRPGSVRDLAHPTPLAITQLRADSLSRSDAVPGWTRWDRINYRDAYLEWHERLKFGRSQIRSRPAGIRPFPLPNPAWSLDRTANTSRAFDVVVLGDFRGNQPRSVLSASVVEIASSSGKSVGVATHELPAPLATRRPALSRQVQRTFSELRATLTHLDAADTTSVLLVTEPELVLHLANQPVLKSAEVWIYVTVMDSELLRHVEKGVRHRFGMSPRWIPTSADIRDQLSELFGTERVHSGAVPVAVAPDLLRVSGSDQPFGDPVVVGHHLPDRAAYWPPGRYLLEAYPISAARLDANGAVEGRTHIDVRMLHGVATGCRGLRWELPPPGWCSMAGTGMSTREFLNHLDVFVYQGPWNVTAHVAALEAMSVGLPTLLPLAAQPTFARASTYAAPADVARTLSRLIAEPDRCSEVVARGRDFVRETADSWVALFDSLSVLDSILEG